MKKNTPILWIAVVIVVAAGLILYSRVGRPSLSDGKNYDEFAICLKDKGALFYGAFWCPHCQNQKDMFGDSAKLLPYVECSTADGKGQLQVCVDKNIKGYPTWTFADGTTEGGEVSLEVLSQKTGCVLPE